MLRVNFNSIHFKKAMYNSVAYSKGYIRGIQMEKPDFYKSLAEYTRDSLYKYIDAKARANPNALHHVYEPGMTGSHNGRLYSFDISISRSNITFSGSFHKSTRPSRGSKEPFENKAEIMENGISITVEPKNAEVLAFEVDGEMVFTRNSIYIEHPGGDEVAGSFGEVIDEFFTVYFNNSMLQPLLMKLQNAQEFVSNFPAGTKGGGESLGRQVGRQSLHIIGEVQ